VLVVSADRNVAQKAREIGAVGWVGKPFDLEALVARIHEVIPP
jgi:DNA-binding response OmpR family regulator